MYNCFLANEIAQHVLNHKYGWRILEAKLSFLCRNGSKSSGAPAQLTIFYAGSVNVYDDISPEKVSYIYSSVHYIKF